MSQCGCGQESTGGQFKPGHDQKVRAENETRVWGILALSKLVDGADFYAAGNSSTEQLATCVRQIFANRH
jgi:hypothetical protein